MLNPRTIKTVLTIGGAALSVAGSIVSTVAADKAMKAQVAKEVAKQLAAAKK